MNALTELAQYRDERARLVAQIEAIDAKIRDRVQTASTEGFTGIQMAEATGLSTQRISQIKRGGRK